MNEDEDEVEDVRDETGETSGWLEVVVCSFVWCCELDEDEEEEDEPFCGSKVSDVRTSG